MKTPEDEAFDDLARKQGAWGGGYQAKRAAAADKLQEPVREALKLALEALTYIYTETTADEDELIDQAIAAIQAALAQPAQEPVALYAAPPQRPWKKLTEEERASFDAANPKTREEWDELFDGIALAQPAQEPEWYHGVDQHGCNRFYHKTEVRPKEFSTQLYTTQPQRPWVGLTDEEIGGAYVVWDDTDGASFADFARAIERLLKEKNNG